jgi:phage-related protein
VTGLFKIRFYKDRQGNDLLAMYLDELATKSTTSKSERIKLRKIIQYFEMLKKHGTRLGEPYVKHIIDGIWDMRPINDRILFFYWKDGHLIMLHHFAKKTNKTPQREIDQAKRNQKDLLERGFLDE